MTFLSRVRLSSRLGLGFGIVLVLLVLITGIALLSMRQMDAQMRQIAEVGNRRIAVAQQMMNSVNEVSVTMFAAPLFAEDADDLKITLTFLNKAQDDYAATRKRFGELIGTVEAGSPRARQLELLDAAADNSLIVGKAVDTATRSGGNVLGAFQALDPRNAQSKWLDEIGKLVQSETAENTAAYEQARADYARASAILGVAATLAVALGLAAGIVILRSVTTPLAEAVGHAERIAGGDLSVAIVTERDDEAGHLLRALATMREQLRGMVGTIHSSTASISAASGEIAQGNLDLSRRTEQSASHLQQTSQAMEELTSSVHQSSDATRQANQLVNTAASVANRGGEVVSKVVATMNDINSSSKKIADIIGVIDGIAFQTNILALNAAVEAARAGEQGRGFAVVAGEVRTLAQRSASAAKEIKALIGSSVDRVADGTRLVDQAGATMQEIVASVKRVSEVIAGITSATAQQSQGIGQVNGSIVEIDEMTQSNAALVEQSASAAESLKHQVDRLAAAVGSFKIAA